MRARVQESLKKMSNVHINKGGGSKASKLRYTQIATRLAKKEMLKNPKYKNLYGGHENKSKKVKAPEIKDILKDSALSSHLVIRDVVKHLSDTRDVGMDIIAQINKPTRENYIECLAFNKLPGAFGQEDFMKVALNEILPMLCISLKCSMVQFTGQTLKQLWQIDNLDSFLQYDSEQESLFNKAILVKPNSRLYMLTIYKQLEFIARIYTLDSKKYFEQSRYWYTYAYRIGLALVPEKVRKSCKIDIFGQITFLDKSIGPHVDNSEFANDVLVEDL